MNPYDFKIRDFFGAAAIDAARAHARAEFPLEACGFIQRGQYVPCQNVHADPENYFQIDDATWAAALASGGVTAVVHSHPNGPRFPSHFDMETQVKMDLPWVIVTLNEDTFGPLLAWGGDFPVAHLIGRPFVHGIFDCYAVIRDIYRLGGERVRAQGLGLDWPLDPIELPEVPRDDDWWNKGEDLYAAHFRKFGFREIARTEARPGDVFLMKFGPGVKVINHGGVLLVDNHVLHHLPTRLSRREVAGPWAYAADLWIRYEGVPA